MELTPQDQVAAVVEDYSCADTAAEVLQTPDTARAAAQCAVQLSMMTRS